MKKLFFSFCLVFLAASFSSQLHAQTPTCTPAQKAACKKMASTTAAATCTPAQKAACQKICNKSASTKTASTEATQNPFLQVLNNTTSEKKSTCNSAAASTKLTKNDGAGCLKKKSSLVKNEKQTASPIAQKVVSETLVSEN